MRDPIIKAMSIFMFCLVVILAATSNWNIGKVIKHFESQAVRYRAIQIEGPGKTVCYAIADMTTGQVVGGNCK